MKNILFTSVMAILMSFSNILYGQQTIEKTSPVKPGDDVKLDFEFADEINVTTWNKNEVYVKAIVSINKNEDNDKFNLEVKQRSTGVEFESEIEDMKSLQVRKRIVDKDGDVTIYNTVEMELSFEVKVPENIDLEIKTISGDIDIKKVLGKLEIETISGFIDLSLPAKHNADLELSTITGSMYSDFEFNNNRSDGYHHYGKHEMTKRINDGGTRIYLETISGDIFIRKAK